MDVSGILTASKYLSTTLGGLLAPSDPAQEDSRESTTSKSSSAQAGDPAALLRDILARYDVTDISPRGFSEMIKKLHEVGTLSDADFQELSLIRQDLEMAGIDPDDELDLVDYYSQKLSELKRSTDSDAASGLPASVSGVSQLNTIHRRLQWLEKFATIQSTPDAVGLDALA